MADGRVLLSSVDFGFLLFLEFLPIVVFWLPGSARLFRGRPLFLRVEARPFYRRLQRPPTVSVIDRRPGPDTSRGGEFALLASPSSMNPVLIYL